MTNRTKLSLFLVALGTAMMVKGYRMARRVIAEENAYQGRVGCHETQISRDWP